MHGKRLSLTRSTQPPNAKNIYKVDCMSNHCLLRRMLYCDAREFKHGTQQSLECGKLSLNDGEQKKCLFGEYVSGNGK